LQRDAGCPWGEGAQGLTVNSPVIENEPAAVLKLRELPTKIT
jgi:hypothetical protein